MIKEKLLRYPFFKFLLKMKLSIKSLIQRSKILENWYDKRSISDFDILKNDKNFIYEKEVEILKKIIKEGSKVFDIGANRGEYSFYLSQVVGINGEVHAFEPGRRAFKLLGTIKKENLLNNLKINKFALSEKIGTHSLIVPYFNRQSQLSSSNPISGRKENINLDTIDNYVLENNITELDFIKCDTEGSELFVFKGGVNTIQKFNPTILVEIAEPHTIRFGYKADEVLKYLLKLNYVACYYNFEDKKLDEVESIDMKPDGHVWSKLDEDLSNNNYLFIHKSKIKEISLLIELEN